MCKQNKLSEQNQTQDNVTEWPALLVGQHYAIANECALSQLATYPDMTMDVAKMLILIRLWMLLKSQQTNKHTNKAGR